jgi:alpha-beta hydrolase superfamily lysophospholipase
MVPIAKRIVRAGGGRLAVFRLLNSVRGWDSRHTPVEDARWALAQLKSRFGTELSALSTCLVGHSLGGRAALLAADEQAVVSAVALAPWVYPTEGDLDLAGRKILIVHGSALAADFAAATLLGGQTSGTSEQALAGQQWIEV